MVYEEIRAQERKLNLEGLPPDQAIKTLIEASFDHLGRSSRLHRAAERREPRRRPACAFVPQAGGDAFAAGQHGLEDPRRRRPRGTFRKGVTRSTSTFHRRPELLLLLQHPDTSAIFGKDLSSAARTRTAQAMSSTW